MIKNLQSQKGLLFGVSNVTEPAKRRRPAPFQKTSPGVSGSGFLMAR